MTSAWRLGVIILLLATAAWSQQPIDKKSVTPADPCGNAGTQMDIGNCQDALAKKADATMDALYQQIQTAVETQMFKSKGEMKTHEALVLEKLKTTLLLRTV